MNKISTQQIGDFKTPNKYWVTWSTDYYFLKDNCYDWASETTKEKVESGIAAIFKTYKEALECANKLYKNCVAIEDRISGELWSNIKVICPTCKKEDWLCIEDTKFTEKELAKRGLKLY